MRALVVLRCGKHSLHRNWMTSQERNGDIVLCPYEPIEGDNVEATLIVGQKWDGLGRFFQSYQARRDYDYICLPDDDLDMDTALLNNFFSLCEISKAQLAAPALTADSFFSHLPTMQNQEFVRRSMSFVEIMMPCFSREFFAEALPTLSLTRSGLGFGLDYVWPHMLSYKDIWIFDEAPCTHA